MGDIAAADFSAPRATFQMGLRRKSSYGDVTIHIPSAETLIKNKQSVGRPQDLLDVSNLQAALSAKKSSPP